MMFRQLLKTVLILGLCASLSSCEQPQVYGSVGFSNWSGDRNPHSQHQGSQGNE